VKPAPDVEFTAAMAVADAAMRPILSDRAVWAEEADRAAAPPLTWPPQIKDTDPHAHTAGLLQVLAITAVEQVLLSMREAEQPGEPEGPLLHAKVAEIAQALDPADPDVQVILRVVHRAVQAAASVLTKEFGGKRGAHRLSGKLKFLNWVKACKFDAAVRSGLPRAEALRALGLKHSSAYRANKRR
jgi:hypothetical protein